MCLFTEKVCHCDADQKLKERRGDEDPPEGSDSKKQTRRTPAKRSRSHGSKADDAARFRGGVGIFTGSGTTKPAARVALWKLRAVRGKIKS